MSTDQSDPVRIIISEACEQVSEICSEHCYMPNNITDFDIEDIDPPSRSDVGPIIEHPEEALRQEIESWLNFQAYIDWDVPRLADSITTILLEAFNKTGAVLYDMTKEGSESITGNRSGTVPLFFIRYQGLNEYWSALVFLWGD